MNKSKITKPLAVFASVILIIIIGVASFAYFGTFNVNLNNNVAVNVNAYSPGDAVFTSNATQLNLQVPAANMSQLLNGTLAAENTATLSVNLTGAADLLTTCTYDIVYEYDSGSYIYGGTGTNHASKNGDKEITLQVTNVNGTNNFATEKNFDYDSSWANNKRTLVSKATISSTGSLTTQNINITGKFYNLNVSQESIGGKAFTGKIYVTNNSCETSEIQPTPITTLMVANNTDIFDENGLRYEGADPNNYICLDNQKNGPCSNSSLLFRIIGLFEEDTSNDGTTSSGTKKLLKEITTNNFGNYDGNGVAWGKNNNWNESEAKTYLNETYLETLLDTANVNTKLSNIIVIAKWHLGGPNDSNQKTLNTEGYYNEERNINAIFSGNPSNLYAKVGLMYPSDLGYATVGGSTTNRAKCRAKELYIWDDSAFSDCKNNSWIFISQKYYMSESEYFISPGCSSSLSFVTVYQSGGIGSNTSDNTSEIEGYTIRSSRPTFYMDAETLKIVGGTGTSADPYHIG